MAASFYHRHRLLLQSLDKMVAFRTVSCLRFRFRFLFTRNQKDPSAKAGNSFVVRGNSDMSNDLVYGPWMRKGLFKNVYHELTDPGVPSQSVGDPMLMSDFRPLVEFGFLFVWVTGSLVRRRPTVLHGLFSCFCLGHVTLQGMDSPENSHVSQERAENKQFPPRMIISVVICECSGQQVIVFCPVQWPSSSWVTQGFRHGMSRRLKKLRIPDVKFGYPLDSSLPLLASSFFGGGIPIGHGITGIGIRLCKDNQTQGVVFPLSITCLLLTLES